MFRRLSSFAVAVLFLLVACGPNSAREILPTATVIPSASVTAAAGTENPTAVPVTATFESPAELATNWLSSLETGANE